LIDNQSGVEGLVSFGAFDENFGPADFIKAISSTVSDRCKDRRVAAKPKRT
jgi:hypothetical protein